MLVYLLVGAVLLGACSGKIVPEKPVLAKSGFLTDTLPLSEIDIPIQVNLKPFYNMAEKKVQTIYSSPGWPQDFVVENCDTRYMYRFKRGPLNIKSGGSTVNIGFTGSYIIAGAQRVCNGTGSNRVPLTPWSPPCTCGLNEPERRVEIGYQAFLRLRNNYNVAVIMQRQEPRPLDQCTLCFWGQDITDIVMAQLKQELDIAGRDIQDSVNGLNLRPQFQQLWNMLNANISLYDLGYLKVNPEKIRLSTLYINNDTLNISLGISARPRISFQKQPEIQTLVPDISDFRQRSGFSIYADAVIQYDSLSRVLNGQMYKKRIDMEKLGKYIVVESCELYGVGSDQLVCKLQFSGSAAGEMYLTGKPVYDKEKKRLTINDLDYDLYTRNALLRTARWLFNKRIIQELNRYAVFDIAEHATALAAGLNNEMNKNWNNGVRTTAKLNRLQLEDIYPGEDNLVLRFHASGDVSISIDSFEAFQF